MVLLAAAAATALVYAVWVAWVPLLPVNLYIPLLDLGKITGYRWSSAWQYLLMVAGLYALYAAGYAAVRRRSDGVTASVIFGAGALFCAELVWAYPATAVDVFGYIAAGRLLALHGVNPFTIGPSAFSGDPIVPYLAYPDEPSQYGPAWVLIGHGFATLARGTLLTEVVLYKLAASAAHLGGGALVYLIARRTAGARAACLSAYLYVWNPLLLWEMVGNAHNDGMMMFFALVAVWLLVAGVDLLVMALLAAGALIKAPVTLIAPMLFIGVWRRSWPRAVEGALLAIGLLIAVYRPFWQGPDTLTALRRTDLFTASLGSVVRLALVPTLGQAFATTVARTTSLSAFAVVSVIALVFALRARKQRSVLMAAYVTLLGALLLATTWFQAWYVVWPFALGAALAEPRRHLEVALLSLGGWLQYFVFIYLWVIGVFPSGENLGVQLAAYLAIIGPLLIGLAIRSVASRRTTGAFTGEVASGG